MEQVIHPVHLLLKPAGGACNQHCRYCFYTPLAQDRTAERAGFMSESTLESVLEKALTAAAGECTVAFQGGEPTLAGLDFFRRAVELERKHNRNQVLIHNTLQTNGLLLDEEWAAFLAEEQFLVGLSLDGDRDLHDLNRPDAQGRGSYDRALRAGKLLRQRGGDLHILTVVTGRAARRGKRLYRSLRRLGFDHLQFIPCLDPLGEERDGYPHSLSAEEYGTFLCDLFDAWWEEFLQGNEVYIRRFANYVGILAGLPPENCAMFGVCGRQLVVEADGSVYPCDFYVLDQYKLGSLVTDSLEELEVRRDATGFVQQSALVHPDCLACRYRPLCRGGCRRDREPVVAGLPAKNGFCTSYQRFFDHCLPRMEQLAALVRTQRGQR